MTVVHTVLFQFKADADLEKVKEVRPMFPLCCFFIVLTVRPAAIFSR